MMKNSLSNSSQVVVLVQLLFPLILAGLYFLFSLDFQVDRLTEVLLLLAGLYIGVGLYLADGWYFARHYLEDGKTGQVMTRSALMALALIPMGIYVITSTGSYLSVGLHLGLLGSLVWQMVFIRSDHQQFQMEFLQQVQRKFSQVEIDRYVGVLFVIFLVFSYWVIK
jgi:hypothetical protein